MEATLAVINTTSAVVKIRPEKKKKTGPYEICTHYLCDTGAALYQSKLSRDQSCRFKVVAAKAKFVKNRE